MWMKRPIDAIVDRYLTEERQFPNSGEDGYRCMLVAAAALESVKTQKVVTL